MAKRKYECIISQDLRIFFFLKIKNLYISFYFVSKQKKCYSAPAATIVPAKFGFFPAKLLPYKIQ